MRSGLTYNMRRATRPTFHSNKMGRDLLGCVVALHICGELRQTFHSNTMQRRFSHYTQTYRYASEKTSAPVFFTLRRLNSPRITIEKTGTTRVKTLKWERSIGKNREPRSSRMRSGFTHMRSATIRRTFHTNTKQRKVSHYSTAYRYSSEKTISEKTIREGFCLFHCLTSS